MYTTRVQLTNYGPFETIDIDLPFDGEVPKTVVLVGENGSGKSILLSHIVNGLIEAKNVAHPETPEVEIGKVYKIRSGSYIKSGDEYYFARIDFENDFYVSEIQTKKNKQDYSDTPIGIAGSVAESMWDGMHPGNHDHYDTNLTSSSGTASKVKHMLSNNCVLYFPPNRFEDPAWLNEDNLKYRAEYMKQSKIAGRTIRRVINYSPLAENQNWLFDVIFDRSAFEIRQGTYPVERGATRVPLPLFLGYSGEATSAYEAALAIVRVIVGADDLRFGIGRRHQRTVSLILGTSEEQYAPSIFHLSSGETALLNLFLSILRDFDLATDSFSNAKEIRGVAVIDEIDLHLHAGHQHDVLPRLIAMFPKVQFIVTTHSPLFVLGMQKAFGDNGFDVYRLPQGRRINPEEFSEFRSAYRVFAATRRFQDDLDAVIEESGQPIVFVEGATDQRYLAQAAIMLEKEEILANVDVRDGGGKGKLAKIWKDSVGPLTETLPKQVLLLFDCDAKKSAGNKGKLIQRCIPMQQENPVEKGIENLFSKATVEKARRYRPAVVRIEDEHGGTDEHGQRISIPEKWVVNDAEKSYLCNWLCENGTAADFEQFRIVFELIERALGVSRRNAMDGGSQTTQ